MNLLRKKDSCQCDIRKTGKEPLGDRMVHGTLFFCAIFSAIVVFFILIFLVRNAYPIFGNVGIMEFIFGQRWMPTASPPGYGAFNIIVGTLLVTLGAIVFAVPLSIGCAIYISEYAPPKVKDIMKTGIELLSGIPSVVFGLFGLIVLTDWIRVTFDVPSGETWLAGSILLGIMAIPTITSVAEDAISAVPKELKEGSLAMGATKWQTIQKVILPAAISGITAAIILGVGRAVGETMAVLMVTGNTAILPDSIFSSVRTLTATLGIEIMEVAIGGTHYNAIFAVGVMLFFIVLTINSSAIFFLNRLKERQFGSQGDKDNKSGLALFKNIRERLKKLGPVLSKAKPFVLWGTAITMMLVWFGIPFTAIILTASAGGLIVFRKLSRIGQEKVGISMLAMSVLIVIFLLGVILFYIFSRGIEYISWEYLTTSPRRLGREGGIFPAIVGTIYLVAGAIGFSLPIGIGAGIYLSEYARNGRVVKLVRAGIDNLNGTPSIVFGLFGFALFVIYFGWGYSLIAGQLTLGLMVLPTLIRTTEEALRSVPQGVREGSLALGSTKWQTIRRVVLPPAIPGIITGTILSIGRAAGETAPIMVTAVTFMARRLPSSFMEPVMALPFHIYAISTEVPGGQGPASGAALVLVLMVLAFYGLAAYFRHRFKRSVKW